MNKQSIDQARDDDLRLSQRAMRRAAQRARELAAQTGTAIIISRNGVVEYIVPGPTHVAPQGQEPPPAYALDGDKE